MKNRKNKSIDDRSGSFWPSFTDIMTTICFVFFLIMIITNVLITKLNEENEDWKKRYAALEEELKDYIENIGINRVSLYEEVEDILKNGGMGEEVIFNKDEGKIEIKTEAVFGFGDAKITEEGIRVAEKVSKAFCTLLENEEMRDKIKYIEIVGHTDFIDTGVYNRTLSIERAANFVNAMLPNGSEQEYKFGEYFKAAGMSEFESMYGKISYDIEKKAKDTIKSGEKNQEEVFQSMGLPTEEMRALDRRIEIRINFREDDLSNVIIETLNKNKE